MNFDRETARSGFIFIPVAILMVLGFLNNPRDMFYIIVFFAVVALIFVGSYYVAGYIGGLLQ